MKNVKFIKGIAVLLCTTALTGCIKETFPLGGSATEEQVQQSPTATKALADGMPASLLYIPLSWAQDDKIHNCFGYPAEMIIRDMLTGDYYQTGETDYSHFISWSENINMGDGWRSTQFHWNFYYLWYLLGVNQVVGAVDPNNATDEQKGYLGAALAFRALAYLDLARMYEFLPNEKFPDGKNNDGNRVDSLTVPIVTEKTTPEKASNNPRATRKEMLEFIEGDLNNAEKYIQFQTSTNGNTMPDLACVYGLKARLYMWVEDYPKAKEYARKAIDAASVSPYTKEVALNPSTGYNTASDFMWAIQQNSETNAVKTGIVNWISWASNQCTFTYTGPATKLFSVIDKRMYERISDTDWRKLQWIAPEGSPLNDQIQSVVSEKAGPINKYLEPYVSVKFRPAQGNADESSIATATAIPVMRVEEMYFIEAEAAEHVSAGEGATLLTSFMRQYRDPNYTFVDQGFGAVEEIVFQKRVELWGEGQTFFDIKRLDMSVIRGYKGTNCLDAQSCLNTNGRPAWMNYVMVQTESNNNHALVGMNNPDPSGLYTQWTE